MAHGPQRRLVVALVLSTAPFAIPPKETVERAFVPLSLRSFFWSTTVVGHARSNRHLGRAQGFALFLLFFSQLLVFQHHHHHRYMMIKGKPCKVLNISVSKTGKHGHAKCNFTATDIFTGKKYEDMIPSTHGTTVPIVTKTEWEVIDINEDGELTLMDEAGNQKTDLNLPTYPEGMADEIRDAWADGENQISVTVQAAVDIEQIIGYKKVSE